MWLTPYVAFINHRDGVYVVYPTIQGPSIPQKSRSLNSLIPKAKQTSGFFMRKKYKVDKFAVVYKGVFRKTF